MNYFLPKKIGHSDQTIINEIIKNPGIPTMELADLIYPFAKIYGKNLNQESLHRDLSNLRKKGLIRSVRHKRVHWYV